MAKILIVDDEYFVRMGIKSIVSQKEYIVAGEAENGIAAAEMILELAPDIVLLDITMPGMDGIQVLEKVRKEGYEGYVVMLTCHEDFRFVQKAIRLGADDYVLKNELVGEELLQYLDDVSEKIRGRLAGRDDRQEIEKQEEQHFYKDNFLKNMLQINGMSREEFARGCARYNVKIHAEGIYFITIYMKHWSVIVERYRDSDMQVLFGTIDNMMEEIFREYPEWEGFYYNPDCYSILFTCSQERSGLAAEQKIRSIVNNISYHFERILDIDVAIVVYRNPYSVEELCKGYDEAKMLGMQRFFRPEQKIFWSGVQQSCPPADLSELDGIITKENLETGRISELTADYVAKQRSTLIDGREFFQIYRRKIAPAAKEYGIDAEFEMEQYEEISDFLKELELIEKKIREELENNEYSYLVRQALHLIQKNFTSKITLEEVAEQLGISAGYFSRIFSGETQETFSNYVIRKRIEYAKELISTTNDKFYEIAEMCGFSSPVHFNNTFKKLCGVTPNQYRREHG